MVLPADVVLVSAAELSAPQRELLECRDDEVVVTRPHARRTSIVVDQPAAALLSHFRSPIGIADAVVAYSTERGLDPMGVIEDSSTLLKELLESRFLVAEGSLDFDGIVPVLRPGDDVDGYVIGHVVQVLDDSDLYRAATADGASVALKVLRRHEPGREDPLRHEAAVLDHLAGRTAPTVFGIGTHEGHPYLAISWCEGVDPLRWARPHQLAGPRGRPALLRLARAVAAAYADLHESGVMHGDVHPGNLLLEDCDDIGVTLVDFGLASSPSQPARVRGGVAYHYDPQLAAAELEGSASPPLTPLSEQFCVASLLFLLVTGAHRVEPVPDRNALLRRLSASGPRSFSSVGIRGWEELESVLDRAMSLDPADRFPSMRAFADALARVPSGRASAQTSSVSQEKSRALSRSMRREISSGGALLRDGLTAAPTCSVNYGAAGVAYAALRFAELDGNPEFLHAADLWLARARRTSRSPGAFHNVKLGMSANVVGSISPYHTRHGIDVVEALVAHSRCDQVSVDAAVADFQTSLEGPVVDGVTDLTLGAAGPLAVAGILLDLVDGAARDSLAAAGRAYHDGLWRKIPRELSLSSTDGRSYLGIAHGWAGILYASLLWSRAVGDPVHDQCSEHLSYLAAARLEDGPRAYWPVSPLEAPGAPEFMPGWCHGSAGYVFLWTLAARAFDEPWYLELAQKSGLAAWEAADNLGSLCCGLTGRAYAQLCLYRATGAEAWLSRSLDLVERALLGSRDWSEARHSLFKGELGLAVLVSELEALEDARLPIFERRNCG